MPSSLEHRRAALALGHEAEEYVCRHLEGLGWSVIAKNWRGGGGELDLVVLKAGALRIVEVKARSPDDEVGLEAIDGRKRRRLIRASRAFLASYPHSFTEVCFMVVLVEPRVGQWRVSLIDNAFDV